MHACNTHCLISSMTLAHALVSRFSRWVRNESGDSDSSRLCFRCRKHIELKIMMECCWKRVKREWYWCVVKHMYAYMYRTCWHNANVAIQMYKVNKHCFKSKSTKFIFICLFFSFFWFSLPNFKIKCNRLAHTNPHARTHFYWKTNHVRIDTLNMRFG